MRKILYSASLFTFLIFLFTGCGSDGSNSSADTNGGTDTTAPEYVSSVVEDSNKNKVVVAFSENITSSGSGFSISIDIIVTGIIPGGRNTGCHRLIGSHVLGIKQAIG